MAKIPKSTGPHQPLQGMARAHRGIMVLADNGDHFQLRAWPRKRPGPGTDPQATAREEFALAVWAVNNMMDQDKIVARLIAEGTPWTWRDVLMTHLATKLILIEGGTLLDIQTALDQLSQLPGAIIIRTASGWAALLPDDDGLPLKLVAGVPAWQKLDSDGMEPTGVVPGAYANANVTLDAAGRVLDASDGGAPPAAGAITLVATRNLTGAAGAEWTGISSANNYMLVVQNMIGPDANLQFGTGAGPSWVTTNVYRYVTERKGSGGFATSSNSEAAAGVPIFGGVTPGTSATVFIIGQQLEGSSNQVNSDGHDYKTTLSGRWTGAGPFTAFRVRTSGANFTSGFASLYQLSN